MGFVRAMPEDGDLAETLLRETRKDVAQIKSILLGDGINEGFATRISHNSRTCKEVVRRIEDLERQRRLTVFPDSDPPATIKARAEAWAIRVGVALAIGTFVWEVARFFIKGPT